MNSYILNGSFLLLLFIVVVVGILLMARKVKLTWARKKGKQEYGPLWWPCPRCNTLVHKNQTMDHMCEA